MSQLTPIDPRMKTMSTREIAELTGKKIGHVNRDADLMISTLKNQGVDDPELDHVRIDRDTRGYITSIALPQGLSITLVTGYSVVHRHRIVKRWQELEDQAAQPALPALPRTFAEALRALADKTEQAEQQAALLIEQAPAVAAQALLAGADGSMCITNAAKALHQRPKDLFAWLSAHRWIYKRAGSTTWVGYQDRIQSGLVEHKTTTVERSDGTEWTSTQVRVTAKGLARLATVVGQDATENIAVSA